MHVAICLRQLLRRVPARSQQPQSGPCMVRAGLAESGRTWQTQALLQMFWVACWRRTLPHRRFAAQVARLTTGAAEAVRRAVAGPRLFVQQQPVTGMLLVLDTLAHSYP